MSFSARDQRILREIARELSAAEPRLARALKTGRLPTLRGRLVGAVPRRGQGRLAWWPPIVILLCLAVGIGMLTAGLVLGLIGLFIAGAVLTQVSPVLAYLFSRTRKSRR